MILLTALLGRPLEDENGNVFGHVMDLRFSGASVAAKDFAATFVLYGKKGLVERLGLAKGISDKAPVEKISKVGQAIVFRGPSK